MEILTDIGVAYEVGGLLEQFHIVPGSDDAMALDDLLEGVKHVVRPKAIYDICYVTDREDDSVTFGGVTFTSRVLTVNLEKVHRVFPWVATCGAELDELPGVKGDALKEYWLEEIKLEALSAARDVLFEDIEKKYRPGKLSDMFPGSLEDWPITQQDRLFSLLGDVESKIGVRLTESFLMVPMKSLSGVRFPTEVGFESCELCPREDCPDRTVPYDSHVWCDRYAQAADRP